MSKKDNKSKKLRDSETIRALATMSHIGIVMAASVFIGVRLGDFLDELLDTSPWFLLIFSVLGVGAAFKSLLDISKKS